MVQCAVRGCKMRSDVDMKNGVRFFCIPKVPSSKPHYSKRRAERRRSLWVTTIGRPEIYDNRHARICSRHFISGKPSVTSDEKSPDWVPSLNLGRNFLEKPVATHPEVGQQHTSVTDATPSAQIETGPVHTSSLATDSIFEAILPDQSYGDKFAADIKPTIQNNEHPILHTEEHSYCQEPFSTVIIKTEKEEDFENECSTEVGADEENTSLNESILNAALEELRTLKEEHSELKNSYVNLRNQLTEAECDKLELTDALADARKTADKFEKECEALKCESESSSEKAATDEITIRKLKAELASAQSKIVSLQDKLDRFSISLEYLVKDQQLLKLYTGLPNFKMFKTFINHMTAEVTDSLQCSLAPWQCVLLTLMRLRLWLTMKDLAQRFGVSLATVSRTFDKWRHHICVKLDPFLRWPDRSSYFQATSRILRNIFENQIVIVAGCFDVFIDRAVSHASKAITVSSCEHHNSVKLVIGVTLWGAICFVSEVHTGLMSDMDLLTKSGLCDNLLPNDVVVVGRGLSVSDLGFHCAKVLDPPSVGGQANLGSCDFVDERKATALRRHAERVISLVRQKFHVLQSALPAEMLTKKPDDDTSQVHQIVKICCALANLSCDVV